MNQYPHFYNGTQLKHEQTMTHLMIETMNNGSWWWWVMVMNGQLEAGKWFMIWGASWQTLADTLQSNSSVSMHQFRSMVELAWASHRISWTSPYPRHNHRHSHRHSHRRLKKNTLKTTVTWRGSLPKIQRGWRLGPQSKEKRKTKTPRWEQKFGLLKWGNPPINQHFLGFIILRNHQIGHGQDTANLLVRNCSANFHWWSGLSGLQSRWPPGPKTPASAMGWLYSNNSLATNGNSVNVYIYIIWYM